MKNFASSCIPKTDFIGVDEYLFALCTCLNYGFETDILLSNVLQASIIVIFVPNADECHFMQQFIKKMYIKELKREEEHEEQQKLKETKLRN